MCPSRHPFVSRLIIMITSVTTLYHRYWSSTETVPSPIVLPTLHSTDGPHVAVLKEMEERQLVSRNISWLQYDVVDVDTGHTTESLSLFMVVA